MDLDAYIASLADVPDDTAFVGTSRAAEMHYMQAHRFHFERVLACLPSGSEPLRMLDVGTTPFTFFVKQRSPHYDVWSLDRTPMLEDRCAGHGVQLRVCDLDDEGPPFEESFFDLIIFTEVLEHIFAPPSRVLSDFRRILRPGGKLILSVPNIAVLKNRIKLALGISPLDHPDSQMKKDWVHGHGHIHEYTMQEIVGVLTGCGFRVGRRTYVRPKVMHALTMPGHSRRERWLRGGYHALQALWPAFGTEILIECYRNEAR